MKQLIFILAISLNLTGFAQSGLGSLKVSALSNNDHKIKHATALKSLELIIIHLKTRDTIIKGSVALPLRTNPLQPGKYLLIAKTSNYP